MALKTQLRRRQLHQEIDQAVASAIDTDNTIPVNTAAIALHQALNSVVNITPDFENSLQGLLQKMSYADAAIADEVTYFVNELVTQAQNLEKKLELLEDAREFRAVIVQDGGNGAYSLLSEVDLDTYTDGLNGNPPMGQDASGNDIPGTWPGMVGSQTTLDAEGNDISGTPITRFYVSLTNIFADYTDRDGAALVWGQGGTDWNTDGRSDKPIRLFLKGQDMSALAGGKALEMHGGDFWLDHNSGKLYIVEPVQPDGQGDPGDQMTLTIKVRSNEFVDVHVEGLMFMHPIPMLEGIYHPLPPIVVADLSMNQGCLGVTTQVGFDGVSGAQDKVFPYKSSWNPDSNRYYIGLQGEQLASLAAKNLADDERFLIVDAGDSLNNYGDNSGGVADMNQMDNLYDEHIVGFLIGPGVESDETAANAAGAWDWDGNGSPGITGDIT